MAYLGVPTQTKNALTKLTSRQMFQKGVGGYSHLNYKKKILASMPGSPLDHLVHLTLHWMETQCTTKYGFLTRVSSEPTMHHSEIGIQNIFDSALIIGTLCDAGLYLSSSVLKSIKRLLMESRNQRSGLWNYFHTDYQLIPHDADTSSVCVSALLQLGILPKVAEQMGKNIFEKAVFHPDGLLDVYFSKLDSESGKGFSSPVFQNWPVVKRVDVSVTANFLNLQEKIQNGSDKLLPSYDLIGRFMQAILLNDLSNPVVTQYAKCYTNIDFILYLISKLDSKKVCRETLQKIVQRRLLKDQDNSISIACRILMGINCGLQNDKNGRKLLTLEVQNLLNLQQLDCFFPELALYNAHGKYHFGSAAISTTLGLSAIFQAMKSISHIERDLRFAF